jgi:hypothetical protein
VINPAILIANLQKVLIADPHSTPIILHWTDLTGGTIDRTTGQKVGAAPTPQTVTIRGLVHFISPTTAAYRMYSQLKSGDAILDLDPSVDLENKPNLTFEFGGQTWTQLTLPEEILRALDAIHGGLQISRVVAVRLKK